MHYYAWGYAEILPYFGKDDNQRFLSLVEDFSNFLLQEIEIAAPNTSWMKMGLTVKVSNLLQIV